MIENKFLTQSANAHAQSLDELNQKINDQPFFISGVIDRFEGLKAVIKISDNQEIKWPINNLPEETAEGMTIRLTLSTDKLAEKEKEQFAKAILNEILKNQG